MEAKYQFLQKENIEKNPDFIEVKRLADKILAILNDPVTANVFSLSDSVNKEIV